METKPPTLTQLKDELKRLTDFYYVTNHPDVRAAIEKVRAENKPRVEELNKRIAALHSAKPAPKPRWPENTPANVLKACQDFWSGTEEYRSFRIHLWNDKAAWTSYPAGGYSTVGGWNPTPAHYSLISFSEREYGHNEKMKPKCVRTLGFERNSGKRVTTAMMQDALDELEKGS